MFKNWSQSFLRVLNFEPLIKKKNDEILTNINYLQNYPRSQKMPPSGYITPSENKHETEDDIENAKQHFDRIRQIFDI